MVHWRREWQATSVFLPGNYEKAKKKKKKALKYASPRFKGIQYPTGGEQRTLTKNSRKKEAAGPKVEMMLVVEIKSDAVKNNTA